MHRWCLGGEINASQVSQVESHHRGPAQENISVCVRRTQLANSVSLEDNKNAKTQRDKKENIGVMLSG